MQHPGGDAAIFRQPMTYTIEYSKEADRTLRKWKKYTADDSAGMWSDEYFMDVDELNKLIRDGRHVKSNRDKIWDEL